MSSLPTPRTPAIELKMLCKTLSKHPEGMSADSLFRAWHPTWEIHQIKSMLDQLRRDGQVKACGSVFVLDKGGAA